MICPKPVPVEVPELGLGALQSDRGLARPDGAGPQSPRVTIARCPRASVGAAEVQGGS